MELMEYGAAAKLVNSYKIKSIESKYVKDAKDAISFSKGKKIVLKVLSSKALHKSKMGLVKVGLSEPGEIEDAFSELVKKGKKFAPYKIIAQKMAQGGIEIIVGGRNDTQFGKMILLGLGGIYVETFKDFALRACPITRFDAQSMIAQLKSRNIVTYNGKMERQLEDLLLKTSALLVRTKLEELDLNPVIIREDGYDVVDIRVLR
ncbi:MAG: acetate--CoA ligase family protein [Candidatus Micrarchaeota archaeon]|nr:acetate--CoA ligase family protein [Candidatus Micrarchaeota archaeon]